MVTHTTVVLLRSGKLVDLGAGERIPPAEKRKKTDPEPDPAVDARTVQAELLAAGKVTHFKGKILVTKTLAARYE